MKLVRTAWWLPKAGLSEMGDNGQEVNLQLQISQSWDACTAGGLYLLRLCTTLESHYKNKS